MDYIHITLQKYTFSLKQQIFEADFLESAPYFSKNENAKMRKLRVSESKQKLASCLPSVSDYYGA